MPRCPDCGAPLGDAETCTDLFNRMLALEWDVIAETGKGIPAEAFQASEPGRAVLQAHFFAVSTYQLQHPDRLEVHAVLGLLRSVEKMLSGETTREAILRQNRQAFDGPARVRRRDKGRDPRLGQWPETWSMTVADICRLPQADYIPAVRRWAEVTSAAIRGLREAD